MKGVGTKPYLFITYSLWKDALLASQDWVNALPTSSTSNPVTHVSLVGADKLQMTHADGTKNVLSLPAVGGGAVD